jgi:phage tail-like protein
MPGPARTDPYGAFNFVVEIDGLTVAGFSEVSGLGSETEVIEYREGNERVTVRKLAGIHKFGNVVLKRGVTANRELWDWRKAVIDGAPARRAVTIRLLDQSRAEEMRWALSEAWPCKWVGPALRASASEVAIETLELACEGIDLVP